MTSQNIFRDMNLDKAKKLMNNLLVIDGRRIFKRRISLRRDLYTRALDAFNYFILKSSL